MVCDNYATHKHPAVKAWLARNPQITLHLTPTSESWLTWSRSSSGSSPARPSAAAPSLQSNDLIEAITAFINGWNERCQPFVWTKDADTIIAKAHRKPTSATQH